MNAHRESFEACVERHAAMHPDLDVYALGEKVRHWRGPVRNRNGLLVRLVGNALAERGSRSVPRDHGGEREIRIRLALYAAAARGYSPAQLADQVAAAIQAGVPGFTAAEAIALRQLGRWPENS